MILGWGNSLRLPETAVQREDNAMVCNISEGAAQWGLLSGATSGPHIHPAKCAKMERMQQASSSTEECPDGCLCSACGRGGSPHEEEDKGDRARLEGWKC